MSYANQLQQLGLNDSEAKTYLALIKLGACSVGKLSQESGIARTSLYYIVKELKEKGFVFEKLINKKRQISAHSPEFLEKVSKNRAEEAKEIADSISKLIPTLKKLAKEETSFSSISHFEGKESVWEVFEIISRSNKDSYWYGFGNKFTESYNFDFFLNNFSKKRRQFGRTKSYNIIPRFPEAIRLSKREDRDFQEFRFLPENTNFDAGICIFGNKIAIFSGDKQLSATIIEGVAVAEIVQSMFWTIWNVLE